MQPSKFATVFATYSAPPPLFAAEAVVLLPRKVTSFALSVLPSIRFTAPPVVLAVLSVKLPPMKSMCTLAFFCASTAPPVDARLFS